MVCISIDGDLYENNVYASKKAIEFTFRFLDFLGMRGNVTWFINDYYKWTTTYRQELLEIVNRDDEIGLHVHKINEDIREGKVSSVKELTKVFNKYKRRIENVIGFKILSFRSGAHAHTPQMFTALENIDILYDSSIIPRKKIFVDMDLYPWSKSNTYVDNSHITKKEFNIGQIKEITNSKWKYFHPTDLVREDGTYKIKNIIKYGLLILLSTFVGVYKISEPKSFNDRLWDYKIK